MADITSYGIQYGGTYGYQGVINPFVYENRYLISIVDNNTNLREVLLKDGILRPQDTFTSHLLGEIFDIRLMTNINGYKELSFKLPYKITYQNEIIKNFRLDYCIGGKKVELKLEDVEDYYIIEDITDGFGSDGLKYREVFCYHYPFSKLSRSGTELDFEIIYNAENMLTYILQDLPDWNVGSVDTFLDEDDDEKIRTLKANGNTNRYELIQEMAELFEGFPIFDAVNKQVNFYKDPFEDKGIVFRYGKNIDSYSKELSMKEVATKLWVEGGEDSDSNTTTYIDSATNNTSGLPYILNFGYFIDNGFLTTAQETAINDFETNISTITYNISQKLLQILSVEDDILSDQTDLEVQNIILTSKKETLSTYEDEYETTQDETVKEIIENLESEISTLENTTIPNLESSIASNEALLSIYESDYEDLVDEKETEEQTLESSVGDFIREKLYKNDNYTDADALYEEALTVSEIYAYAQYEETINVVDLSKITDFEIEEFDIYTDISIDIPDINIYRSGNFREITYALDNPQDTSCNISTTISGYEDYLTSSFSMSNELTISKEAYNRVKGLNPDGTVNATYMQELLNKSEFILNVTSNTYIDPTEGLISIDSNNSDNIMKINSSGILISTDGGDTWSLATDASGIVAQQITTGTLDTSQLRILSSEGTFDFFFDGDGIQAWDRTRFSGDNTVNDVSGLVILNDDGLNCYKYTLSDPTTTTLAISGTTTTFTVSDNSIFPISGSFIVRLENATQAEMILCDSISGSTITINSSGRGYDKTATHDWVSGSTIYLVTKTNTVDINKDGSVEITGNLTVGGSGNDGVIAVLDDSDSEIITLDNEGITLSGGAKLIGGNGVLSTFKFATVSGLVSAVPFGSFTRIGYYPSPTGNISIPAYITGYIPDNFTVTSVTCVTRNLFDRLYSGTYQGLVSGQRISLATTTGGNDNVYLQNLSGDLSYYLVDNISYTAVSSYLLGTTTWAPTASGSIAVNKQTSTDEDLLDFFTQDTYFTLKLRAIDTVASEKWVWASCELFITGYSS